jgi:hypothetical protein
MPQIKYIGKKDFFPDFVAQSGKSWNGYGDVQEVTDDQAKKLLVHDDEFAEKNAHDALLIEQSANIAQIPTLPDAVIPPASDAQEVTAEEISVMNKVELFALAEAKGIPLNDAAPVAALRKQLVNLLFKTA